jgi:8-oxo-dGTP pyrophosphatase MutT (NUDIX family)
VNNHIVVIDQQDVDPSVPMGDRSNYFVRNAARAVIADEDGRIALIYAKQRNYYKLPGGGIEEGEDIHEALKREILEEVGCDAVITSDLGIIEEWRDFHELHQISHCFAAKLVGNKGIPDFTESEIEEGFEVVWVADVDAAIRLVELADTADAATEVKFMTRRDATILRTSKNVVASAVDPTNIVIESVAKVLIVDNLNRALVLTLSEHRTHPERSFLPDLPGGIVDPGESERDAAVRETKEEAGIELTPGDVRLAYARTAFYKSENKSVTKLLYIIKIEDAPEVTLSWEHDSYEWVPLDKILQAITHPSFYREAIEYVTVNYLV